MTKRILIYSGGSLTSGMLEYISADDVVIGADRGAFFLVEHGIRPDVALGDFDSVSAEQRARIQAEAKTFVSCDPVMKDLTDTEMALEHAMAYHPNEIMIFGALGTRFDHSLANVHLLKRTAELGIPCTIIDAHNRLSLVVPGKPSYYVRDRYRYISLLPLSELVTGIHLEGFMYPLIDAQLSLGSSRGISNQIKADQGIIRIGSGWLLVIESVD